MRPFRSILVRYCGDCGQQMSPSIIEHICETCPHRTVGVDYLATGSKGQGCNEGKCCGKFVAEEEFAANAAAQRERERLAFEDIEAQRLAAEAAADLRRVEESAAAAAEHLHRRGFELLGGANLPRRGFDDAAAPIEDGGGEGQEAAGYIGLRGEEAVFAKYSAAEKEAGGGATHFHAHAAGHDEAESFQGIA